jgi:hypothetical protein
MSAELIIVTIIAAIVLAVLMFILSVLGVFSGPMPKPELDDKQRQMIEQAMKYAAKQLVICEQCGNFVVSKYGCYICQQKFHGGFGGTDISLSIGNSK